MSIKNSQSNLPTDIAEISLRSRIKHYKNRVQKIEEYLDKNPHEWGKFQSEFNAEVNTVFREIMMFEKENMANGNENKVYKLKRLFINKIRLIFEKGDLTEWIQRKPHGYAGDFKIIEDIYKNSPKTNGFERLFDNYVQMSSISVAIRNRKNDFKKIITSFVKNRKNQELRIMNLASGPCREIKELLSKKELYKNVTFDCYDHDEKALKYASNVLKNHSTKINFIKENAARIAFRKNINSLINDKYDLIYSTGLFDYFEEKVSTKLLTNLRNLLKPNGSLIISDVRDKYSNPSVHFMEWVGEWELVYCGDGEFKKCFINAGFTEDELELQYEQQGILQYVTATNKNDLKSIKC